jgi:hypothetical protein
MSVLAHTIGQASVGRILEDSRVGHRATTIWQAHGSAQGGDMHYIYVYEVCVLNILVSCTHVFLVFDLSNSFYG